MSSFLARTIRDSFLASLPTSIVVGHLVVVDNANGLPGDVLHFGQQDAPGVTLTINNNHFWLRLLLSGTISLGEAYMAGEVDIKDGDLEKIMLVRPISLQICLANDIHANLSILISYGWTTDQRCPPH